MKIVHRGHTIELSREEALGGWESTYYTITRDSDGFICRDSFTEDETPLSEMAEGFKGLIDDELLQDNPWGEEEL